MREGGIIQGKYRVLRLIGDGGMGSVYEAEHEQLGSRVALKFLQEDVSRRPGVAERFRREARVSAAIQSAHVARVTDVDTTDDGSPFLVMELLEGRSLTQVLAATRAAGRSGIGYDRSIDFALQILAGLEAAHGIGVVHRDLKPDNAIVIDGHGGETIKLIDFGIAKLRDAELSDSQLTHAGTLMGTPEYMAPEQLFSASDVDCRADIYSVGVMLYELLSGQRPARGETAAAIVASVQLGEVRPLHHVAPRVSEDLSRIVHRALLADREARTASAYDFRQALIPFAGSLSHPGQLAATPRRMSSVPPTSARPPADANQRAAHSSAAEIPTGHSGVDRPRPAGGSELEARLRREPECSDDLPGTVPPVPRGATRPHSAPVAPERDAPGGSVTVLGDPDPTRFEAAGVAGGAALMTGLSTPPRAPTRLSRRSGISPKVLWALLGVSLCGGVALAILAAASRRPLAEGPPSPPSLAAPPPLVAAVEEPTTKVAREPSASPAVHSEPATVERPRTTRTAPSPQPPAATSDGDTDAPTPTADRDADSSDRGAGERTGPFGLPLPASLPPLPSSLPELSLELPDSLPKSLPSALPSGFPKLPSWATDSPPAETPEENVRRQ